MSGENTEPPTPAGDADEAEETSRSRIDGPTGRGTGPRSALLIAGALALVLVVGAGLLALRLLSGGGTQPAAVLPADSVVYVGIDLDPPASQKLAAFQFFRAFPDLRDDLPSDEDEDDDPRRALVELALEAAGCDEVSFTDDIDPWLGDRAALVLRPGGGSEPVPVVVLQTDEEEQARDGIAALAVCASGEDTSGVAFADGYVVVAPTQAQADAAVADAATNPLDADADFVELTEAAGQDGIVEAYVSSAFVDEVNGALADPGLSEDLSLFTEPLGDAAAAAVTVRFADAGLEVVAAAPLGGRDAATSGGQQLSSMPAESLLAVAGGVPGGVEDAVEEFVGGFEEGLAGATGDEADQLDLLGLLEEETGLRLPADLRTLLGSRTALAIGDEAASQFVEGIDDETAPPLAIGVLTDSDEAEVTAVVDKIGTVVPVTFAVESGARGTAYGLDLAWTERLASGEGATLGDREAFGDVVGELEGSSFGLFLDLNGSWTDAVRAELSRDEAREFDDVVSPLSGVGAVARVEDGLQIARLRVGTD